MISKCKRIAKEAIKGKIGIMIVIYLITMAISVALSLIGFDWETGEQTGNLSIASYFIIPCFEMSIIICTFKILNNEKPTSNDITSGFNNYWKVIGTYALVTLYTFLWSLLIIPAFIKPFSYAMAMRIIRDNPELTANEAITKSREMMDGHKMELFLMELSFIGWIVLSLFTAGILLLWVEPYLQTAITQFYIEIGGKGNSSLNNNDGIVNRDSVSYEELSSFLKEKKCPLCGKVNSSDKEYCTVCGEKLDSDNYN